MTSVIHNGDALAVLRTLPSESVHCVVTSPPYWRLRDYGCAGQIGLEERVDCGWHAAPARFKALLAEKGVGPCGECFVCRLVAVFREVRRVLRADGTAWVNMGDSYAVNHGCKSKKPGAKQAQNRGSLTVETRRNPSENLKDKDISGGPWRLALALQADGWVLRSDIIWNKPSVMPESVLDRPTKSHEYLFLLVKNGNYYYDIEAIKVPIAESTKKDRIDTGRFRPVRHFPGQPSAGNGRLGDKDKRNIRSVWTIPNNPFPEAHFATFPPALVEPCLKAGCPVGGVVLDPFLGSGTVGLVARRLGRRFIGIDLNPKYCRMAQRRIERDSGLFGPVPIVAAPAETRNEEEMAS